MGTARRRVSGWQRTASAAAHSERGGAQRAQRHTQQSLTRHRVHRPVRGADQHHRRVVLAGLVADVTVLLDQRVHVHAVVDRLVVQQLRCLAQAEHAHALVLVRDIGNYKLGRNKRPRRVDHHALARLAHQAVFLAARHALAHEALFVHARDDRHVGHLRRVRVSHRSRETRTQRTRARAHAQQSERGGH